MGAGAVPAAALAATGSQQRAQKHAQKHAPMPEAMMDIGVSVAEDPRGILIATVVKDGPADAAGLRAGDIIVEQDGRPLAGMHPVLFLNNSSYVRLGQTVEFTILRDGATITRRIVCCGTTPELAIAARNLNTEAEGRPAAATSAAPAAAPATVAAPPPAPALLGIAALAVRPSPVAAGSRFAIEVTFVAPGSAPVTFMFTIFSGDRELLTLPPERIEGGGGALMTHSLQLEAAAEPGEYRVRVRLEQGDEAVERTAALAVTASGP